MLDRKTVYALIAEAYELSGGHGGVLARLAREDARIAGRSQAVVDAVEKAALFLGEAFRMNSINRPTLLPVEGLPSEITERLDSVLIAANLGPIGESGPSGSSGPVGHAGTPRKKNPDTPTEG
jgi:hypothetical protein